MTTQNPLVTIRYAHTSVPTLVAHRVEVGWPIIKGKFEVLQGSKVKFASHSVNAYEVAVKLRARPPTVFQSRLPVFPLTVVAEGLLPEVEAIEALQRMFAAHAQFNPHVRRECGVVK